MTLIDLKKLKENILNGKIKLGDVLSNNDLCVEIRNLEQNYHDGIKPEEIINYVENGNIEELYNKAQELVEMHNLYYYFVKNNNKHK